MTRIPTAARRQRVELRASQTGPKLPSLHALPRHALPRSNAGAAKQCRTWLSPNRTERTAFHRQAEGFPAGPGRPGFHPRSPMTGVVDYPAGVSCSPAGAEPAASWLQPEVMPFDRVHGHEGVWWWRKHTWHDEVPEAVIAASGVGRSRRLCSVRVGDPARQSVDRVLGAEVPHRMWVPDVLPDVRRTTLEPSNGTRARFVVRTRGNAPYLSWFVCGPRMQISPSTTATGRPHSPPTPTRPHSPAGPLAKRARSP